MNRQWYYLSIAVIILSFLFRQPLLLVVGLLGLLVLVTADVWARYCLTDLRYQRQFSEKRVLFGEEVTMSLSVENAKLLPLPWLEIMDTVPNGLTFQGRNLRMNLGSNQAVLENLFSPRWYERVTRRYTILCNTRGVHTFGPTRLHSGDIFGFIERTETADNREYVLVYPLVVPLRRFSLPARYPFGEHRAPRRLLEDPSRVIGVRDYMYGDDLRRVHWKATARTMQLQSKVYEATTTYTLVMFLNIASALDARYGVNPEYQELTICAAASIADWALNEGYAVGLYANCMMYMPEIGMALPSSADEVGAGPRLETVIADQLKQRRIHLPAAGSEEQRKRIMEALARIQSYFGTSIEGLIQTERTRLPAGATVVVITSVVSDPLVDSLVRLRQEGHAVSVLFVGDQPFSPRIAGVTVYNIGGAETWKQLTENYNIPEGEIPAREMLPVGLQL